MPRAGHVQSYDRPVLESGGAQRHGVQRRQRVHADGHVSERRVRRHESGGVHRFGPVPRREHVQSSDGPVFRSAGPGRHGVQRRRPVHDRRRLQRGVCTGTLTPEACLDHFKCYTTSHVTPLSATTSKTRGHRRSRPSPARPCRSPTSSARRQCRSTGRPCSACRPNSGVNSDGQGKYRPANTGACLARFLCEQPRKCHEFRSRHGIGPKRISGRPSPVIASNIRSTPALLPL
jgi:hypothetical protein